MASTVDGSSTAGAGFAGVVTALVSLIALVSLTSLLAQFKTPDGKPKYDIIQNKPVIFIDVKTVLNELERAKSAGSEG